MKRLLSAILTLGLLSGCAYVSGLKNKNEAPIPSADTQDIAQPKPRSTPSAATGASKAISPITQYVH